MPTELYERIVGELAAYRDTIEGVFMINYNEPTADKRFVDQVRAIKAAGLPPAVLTNGSGLTPDRIDALVEMGGLRFLSINLSTLDRERYQRRPRRRPSPAWCCATSTTPGTSRWPRRWTWPCSAPATTTTSATSRRSRQRFAGSRFDVKYYEVMDRAGYLQIGHRPAVPQAAALRLRERRLAAAAAPPHHAAGQLRALLRGLRRQVRGGRPHPGERRTRCSPAPAWR